MALNLKEKTSRIAGLMVGARLAGVAGSELEAMGAWLDGFMGARLDAREIEPRVGVDALGLELLGWHEGLPRPMADWIGAGLNEAERERFFELATRLGRDSRRVTRWAGRIGPGGRGYALAGALDVSASRVVASLDLELAELVLGDDGVRALVPMAEAARTEDLVELARVGSRSAVAFPLTERVEVWDAWRAIGGDVAQSHALETLLARRVGVTALTAEIDDTGLVSRGLRVPIADPVALAAALSAARVDEALDERLAGLTAAFERELPSWVELRLSASGTALVCGFPASSR